MTNVGTGRRVSAKQPNTCATTFWRHRGYTDARSGLGFAPEYDGLRKDLQLNYERGRCEFAALAGAGLRPPAWRRNAGPLAHYRRCAPSLRNVGAEAGHFLRHCPERRP